LLKAPWANVALLGILLTLLVSGYWGLVSGQEKAAWRLWLHGIAAYALIVIFVWKGGIILDACRRKNRWTWQRILFAFLLALLLAVVGMGLLWTMQGPLAIGGLSLLSWHIYGALTMMALMAWHGWRQRFIFRVKGSLDRRLFLGAAGAAVVGALLWRTAEWGKGLLRWAGAARRFTGSYERGSFTGQFPVVSWIADDPPPVDRANWRLVIDGAVVQPLSLAFEELAAMPATSQEVVLDCTGGWYTRQVWQGVPILEVLGKAGVLESAVSVTVEAVTGYKRRFDIVDVWQMVLAYGVAGRPLAHGHGAPLRLVIPGRRGVEWVKWITAIHVNRTSELWQSPLPLQ
jgi:DMSO/TMAO reductase YedYZ molybdopterin-dependent catalytic subunit